MHMCIYNYLNRKHCAIYIFINIPNLAQVPPYSYQSVMSMWAPYMYIIYIDIWDILVLEIGVE